MNRARKLAALGKVAELRRDAALQALVHARAEVTLAKADLTALDAAHLAATGVASSDVVAARQFDCYSRWAKAQRLAGEVVLADAAKRSEICRAAAQVALGRTDALARLVDTFAAEAAAIGARRV